MKWAILAAIVSLSPLVEAKYSCVTKYGPHPVTSVPTVSHRSTVTTDKVVVTSAADETIMVTKFRHTVHTNYTFTFTSSHFTTVAPTTTIVPTSPGFTPAASATTSPSASASSPASKRSRSFQRKRRRGGRTRGPRLVRDGLSPAHDAVQEAQTSSKLFPTEVYCNSETTDFVSTSTYDYNYEYATTTVTVPTLTLTTGFLVRTSTTSTIHTSIATVYQGCAMPDNRISQYHGVPIYPYGWDAYQDDIIGFQQIYVNEAHLYDPYLTTGESTSGDQTAVESALRCCHAAFDRGCSGWAWEDNTGTPGSGDISTFITKRCDCLNSFDRYGWFFFAGTFSQPDFFATVGNGPQGHPYFGGYHSK